ncbi:co-regulatory protein PtrA N-terminal domain-containing protein [Pseudomonas sp. RT4P38]
MKSMKSLLLVGSLLLSSAVWAADGSDRLLKQIQTSRDNAEAKLTQIEKAPACGRHASMTEHMGMLDNLMAELHKAQPTPDMSTEQHLAWMQEHDKLMKDVLGQMMREHKLMMGEKQCRQ